jgi:hypothetical protein
MTGEAAHPIAGPVSAAGVAQLNNMLAASTAGVLGAINRNNPSAKPSLSRSMALTTINSIMTTDSESELAQQVE